MINFYNIIFVEELAIVEASSLLVEEEGTGLLPSGAEIGNHDTALQSFVSGHLSSHHFICC